MEVTVNLFAFFSGMAFSLMLMIFGGLLMYKKIGDVFKSDSDKQGN